LFQINPLETAKSTTVISDFDVVKESGEREKLKAADAEKKPEEADDKNDGV